MIKKQSCLLGTLGHDCGLVVRAVLNMLIVTFSVLKSAVVQMSLSNESAEMRIMHPVSW